MNQVLDNKKEKEMVRLDGSLDAPDRVVKYMIMGYRLPETNKGVGYVHLAMSVEVFYDPDKYDGPDQAVTESLRDLGEHWKNL
jgi:hypothetical protein